MREPLRVIQGRRKGRALVFAGKQLDGEWAQRIVNEHYADVLAYCRRHAPCAEDARDAAQETFLRFIRSMPSYRDQGKPLALLLVIARHACADLYRRRGRTWEMLDENLPAPESENASTTNMHEALAALPAEQRELLELRYDQGLQVNEIAKVLGVSRFSASRKIAKALEALKTELEKDAERGDL